MQFELRYASNQREPGELIEVESLEALVELAKSQPPRWATQPDNRCSLVLDIEGDLPVLTVWDDYME